MTSKVASTPAFGLVLTALVTVYVVWGSTYLAIRIVVEQAPPLTSMGLRYTAAAVVLGAILIARGGPRRLRLTGRQALGAGFLGLMLPVLGNGMVSVAENLGATSGVTALLIAIAPLLIVVFRVAEGDRPQPATMLGVALGFVGLGVLVLLGRGGADGFGIGPALIVLFASTCWAFGSYVQPRLWLPADVFVTTVYEMLFGGLMLVALGLVSGERFTASYDARTWTALAYLVVFGSVIAFTAYVWLIANAPISFVATYAYVNPIVAVFLGWLVLSERVTAGVLAGGGIVVLAVALVIGAERPRRRLEAAGASSGEPVPEPVPEAAGEAVPEAAGPPEAVPEAGPEPCPAT
jgi:drug/metabolite transporter (DMT)-like permease